MTVPISLQAPEAKEVVPAEAVEGLLHAVQDELDALERQLTLAQGASGVTVDEPLSAPDPTLHARATEFVEAFLVTLTATTDRELDDELAAARAEASARVAAAEARAEQMLAEARDSIADAARHLTRERPSGDAPLGLVTLRSPAADGEPVDDLAARLAGTAAQAFSPEAPPLTPPGPIAPAPDEPVDDLAARLAGAAAQAFRPAAPVVAPAPVREWAPVLEPAPVPEPARPMIDAVPPPAHVADDEPPPVEVEQPAPVAAGSDEYEEFWEEGDAATKARRRFFVPIEAVLPMLAVVIVVVVILAWVG